MSRNYADRKRADRMELKAIEIEKPSADVNVIVGQAHFIKTVEDLYEALVQAVPGVKFGVAFCEASGPCLVRHTGTDEALAKSYAELHARDRLKFGVAF